MTLHETLSFSRLFNLSEPKRIVRSNTVKGPPLDIKAFDNAQYHIFNFKSNPSTTGLRHHGYIKFDRPKRDQPLSEIPCHVDCTCQDYKYRYAWTNKQRGSSKVGPTSLNQAINRPPRITNPSNKPGLCKHILALKNYIQGMMWDIPKTGIKSSEDVLSGLVKYATKRWDQLPQQMSAAKARDARFAAARATTRAGRAQPDPSQLPDIPTVDEPEEEVARPGPESDVPDMPTTVDQANKLLPPKLNLRPEKQPRKESIHVKPVDSMSMTLNNEIRIIQSLIEDEAAQTPPTEGETSKSQALQLLRSIDQGIRSLNTGIQALTAKEATPAPGAEEPQPGGEDQASEVPGDGQEPQGDESENLEQELKKLGVPQ